MSNFIIVNFGGGILSVTINRPEKLNALNVPMITELGFTFSEWSAREDVAVATLTGAGAKCFVSGGDVQELSLIRSESDAAQFSTASRKSLDAIRRFPAPVVA